MATSRKLDREKRIAADCALIERLGGAAVVARLLGLEGERQSERVQNWKARGIPAAVKLMYPEILLPKLVRKGGKRK